MAAFTPIPSANLVSTPQLLFDICQINGCSTMTFSETTGAYSANNLLGWNSPNPTIDDATSATLYITDPANSTFSIDLFSLSPSWPTTDSTQLFTIHTTDVGQANGNFLDGLYKFQYVVYINDDEEYVTKIVYIYSFCNIECCVDKMFAKITDPSCDCQADAIAAASKADALLTALKKAAECGKTDIFCSLLNVLSKICTNANCQTCN